ncbi:MAG: hypothetical protein KDE52_06400, partial [Calditrichaeota bacterium]|nr:hypothetical protein [Calditrichota bacterium]
TLFYTLFMKKPRKFFKLIQNNSYSRANESESYLINDSGLSNDFFCGYFGRNSLVKKRAINVEWLMALKFMRMVTICF